MEFEPKNLKGEWFLLDVELFHSRVFAYIGSRREMVDSAVDAFRNFGLEDSGIEELSGLLYHKSESGWCDDCHTNGDCFGLSGNGFIRLERMETGNVDDILILSHESLHAANAILKFAEVREDDNIECLCYTHEYIFGKLLKQMCELGLGKKKETKDGKEKVEC